jgi:hypothetical protein
MSSGDCGLSMYISHVGVKFESPKKVVYILQPYGTQESPTHAEVHAGRKKKKEKKRGKKTKPVHIGTGDV